MKSAANTAPTTDPHLDDPEEDIPLYEARKQIYPQSVRGRFRTIKWAMLIFALAVYYLLPFVRWDRGPDAPSQAVLIDFPARRFYFFFIEIWPQEFYYVAGLLILAALVLFLMTAVAGRVWCGYMCPQTIWTDLFMWVERLVQGDRRARIMLDAAPMSANKFIRKALTHILWVLIGVATGVAFVLYFANAPTILWDMLTLKASFTAYATVGVLTFTTYVLAGLMREQVCTYMCPWPRIQASLTDEYALNVTYCYDRGEPRASMKKAKAARASGQAAGDCIDCGQCVHVCPTGVDIRQGMQLSCIQCGLCIDACNTVMEKVGRPGNLIMYDSEANLEARVEGKPFVRRIIRARTILYTLLILFVSGLMLSTLVNRSSEGLAAIHDRNPLFVKLSDGSLRNAYTLRLTNKVRQERAFGLAITGVPGATLQVVGESGGIVTVGPDQTQEVRVLVTTHEKLPPKASLPITFRIRDAATGAEASVQDHFIGP
ncbi:MAG: cytochrome c oxidase accessory protein CcoG [Xanthobacter sp.]